MEKITSRHNPLVAELRRLAGEKSARREAGLLLGQGYKLLTEALAAGLTPQVVLTAEEAPDMPEGIRCCAVTEELLAYISPMKSAPELIFTAPIPEETGPVWGRVLLAENMQDPGNVGAMIRTAAAFGFDGILLAGACADPWSPKAVRSSMGAVFRLKIWERSSTEEALEELREENLPLCAAALAQHAQKAGSFRFPERFALAVGNEGHGLSEEILSAAEKIIRIPMTPGAESLNAAAAAAVLMWESYREREDHV
jgi:TrmH family RNA methyltransferase